MFMLPNTGIRYIEAEVMDIVSIKNGEICMESFKVPQARGFGLGMSL